MPEDSTEPIERARSDLARLKAVNDTGLLDAPSTAALDRLTRLASTLVGAPATFITLVDADRDFYVSNSGFGEPLASQREMRGTTFCHYALVNDGPLVIDDTRGHPVYSEVSTVKTLGVAAYLGVPFHSATGEVLGSFCAVDFEPRDWSPAEIGVMSELASSAAHEIALHALLGSQMRKTDEALAAHKEAERRVTMRQDVLNAVSHDLRDPLNTILMALGSIEARGDDPELVARTAKVIRRQGTRMTRLLEDLLDVARIDGKSMGLETGTVDLPSLLAEVAGDFAHRADAAGVTFAVSALPGPAIDADRRRLLQALSNLVSNSLRFTPRGGTVRLAAERFGDRARLEVTDTGCGIAEGDVGKIFEAFWQGSGGRTGTGLGLYIVRGIVERHGGTVRVRSGIGAGTTFEIEIPVTVSA